MKDELAGTTAVVAILRNNKIYCVSIYVCKILEKTLLPPTPSAPNKL